MTILEIFKGSKSMTGKSFKQEFPGITIDDANDVNRYSFDEILERIEQNQLIGVLPIWNSFVGEIKIAKVIDSLFDKEMRLHHIWPNEIVFSCIIRKNNTSKEIKNTISINIAKNQCSDFIEGNSLEFLVPDPNDTVEAYNKFSRDTTIDSVLCNKDLCDENTQEIYKENASNPLNFTTFVVIGKESDENWPSGGQWDLIRNKIFDKRFQISAIEMPYHGGVLTETQLNTLGKIFENKDSLSNLPRPIFINRREGGRIGIVFENNDIGGEIFDIYPDLEYSEELKIVNDGGATKDSYTNKIIQYVRDKNSFKDDQYFWKHTKGSNSFLYLCPVLNIAIHGFEEELVEFITKHFIIKFFELHINGIDSNELQKEFFKKYKDNFKNIGIDSIQFTEI